MVSLTGSDFWSRFSVQPDSVVEFSGRSVEVFPGKVRPATRTLLGCYPAQSRGVSAGTPPGTCALPATCDSISFTFPIMTNELIEEALKVIPNQQLLINVVSQRVKQLNKGHRPLVETTPRMPASDIALKEIADRKIQVEQPDSVF